MAYIDQDFLENYLKRSLSTREAAIFDTLVAAAKTAIDAYTARTFETQETESRLYDGDGSHSLEIDDAQDITAVELLDSAGDVTQALTTTEDYRAYPYNDTPYSELIRKNGRWPRGTANVRVSAKFGYTNEAPATVKLAAAMLIADSLSGAGGNKKSESIEGYSYTLADTLQEDDEVKRMLDPLRKVLLNG